MANDWLPVKESDFVKTGEKWIEVLSDKNNVSTYGWKEDACVHTVQKIVRFMEARTVYENNDSSVNSLMKKEARDDAKSAMRDFANTSIRFNKLMEDGIKLYLGIRQKDSVLTIHPNPVSQPDTLVETTTNRFEHRLKAANRESHRTVKPADAYGIRYAWKVGGERPETGADLPKGKFSRKTSIIVSYTEADKGKTVWYASCYENAKGDAGPWSALVEAYIW